jgi:hypothetical protein
LGGDRSGDAGGVAADGVELAFDEHERLRVLAGHAGAVEVEDRARLLEELGLGRVDVFRLAGRVVLRGDVELAGGEGDDAALDVADRNHEPAAETAAPAQRVGHAVDAEEQARLREGVLAVALGEQSGDELRIVDGREADAEVVGDLR